MMPVAQATLSFVLELREFHNVDLFHRGYYQIRSYIKATGQNSSSNSPLKNMIQVEPPVIWDRISSGVRVSECVQSSYIASGSSGPPENPDKMCSKTLMIMYQDEAVQLGDVFEQRLMLLVDPCNLDESISKYSIWLCVELWFCEDRCSESSVLRCLEKVHTRQLRVHLSPQHGLHHHFDVFFDYFHLCAVEFAMHATLINVTPNVVSIPSFAPAAVIHKSPSQVSLSQQSWHSILFNVRTQPARTRLAREIHSHICHTLLAARESMLLFWREILPHLSVRSRPHIKRIDFLNKLEQLTSSLQTLTNDEELANQISIDISRLSSQNAALLRQLCKSCVLQPSVASYLRRKTHQIRMKRFSEAFFCQELSVVNLMAVYDPGEVGHELLANEVRQSLYFQHIPTLPVTCRELDGDVSTMPIIFEDVFLTPTPGDPLSHAYSQSNIDTKRATPMANGIPVSEKCSRSPTENEKSPKDTTHLQASLTPNTRRYCRSTPSLSLLDDTNSPAYLPPVLRYLSQQKKRSRVVAFPGRRSVNLYRSPLPSLTPENKSIKLLGFRTFDPDDVPASDRDNDDGRLSASLPESSQRQRGSVLLTRDLRSRCNSMPRILLTSASPVSSKTELEPAARQTRSLSGSFEHECMGSLQLVQFSSNHVVGSATKQVVARPQQHHLIALGSLRPPPLDPPGGVIPQTLFSNVLGPSVSGDIGTQCRTLPCRSVPNIHSACGLDAAGKHSKGWKFSHHIPIVKRPRRPGPNSRRHSLAAGGTYTSELARLSSVSEWNLLTVASTKLTDSPSPSATRSDASNRTKSLSHSSLSPVSSKFAGLHSETARARVQRSISLTESHSSVHLTTFGDGSSKDAPTTFQRRSATLRNTPEKVRGRHVGTIASCVESRSLDAGIIQPELQSPRNTSVQCKPVSHTDTRLVESKSNVTNGFTVETEYSVITDDSEEEHVTYEKTGSPIGLSEVLPLQTHKRSTHLLSSSKSFAYLSPSDSRFSHSDTKTSDLDTYTNDSRFTVRRHLAESVSPEVLNFLRLKESVKQRISMQYSGNVYSDFASVACPYPFFSEPTPHVDGVHLVVCVHGLDGNSNDLRLVRIYLELALPDIHLEFLMSECNQQDTFAGFDQMRDNLVLEIIDHVDQMSAPPERISFVGHSMGCVVIRAALLSPLLKSYAAKFHTFLSLSGPHLGTVYNPSGLVNMGIWVMQKWKKSESLAQLRLRDSTDLRSTYIYRLNTSPGLELFRYVLLVGSPQDRYVPYHSTRIELCKAAVRDTSPMGVVYMEMVTNVLQRLIKSSRTTVVRYDVHYSLGNSANSLIGRAAHIAVLDSELFLEKFICVSAAKYFR